MNGFVVNGIPPPLPGRLPCVTVIRRAEGQTDYLHFQEEYVEFLKRSGVEYDERFLW